MTDQKPFAPHYAVTSEYLFDLARWFANQDRLPEVGEVSGDFRYVHEFEAFRDRVFALMVGSEVSIKPGYWLTNLDGSNPMKLDDNFYEASAAAVHHSQGNLGVTYRIVKQYIHALRTVSERVAVVIDGELYRR